MYIISEVANIWPLETYVIANLCDLSLLVFFKCFCLGDDIKNAGYFI